MTDSSSLTQSVFYMACCNNNLKTALENFKPSEVNKIDADGNTVLHIASSRGYIDIVRFLLRYHAPRTIRNNNGLIAEQLAMNEEIKMLFNVNVRPKSDSDYFVATTSDVEWVDTYNNADRISYENLEHMKRWVLKVPLQKLLDEIYNGYINKLQKLDEKQQEAIKDLTKKEIPKGLIKAYTCPSISFYKILNEDLAEVGSDFRFLSTQNLINSGYLDNEAPKGLGQHIFAAIIINHPYFRPFYWTGTSYRGMNVTQHDLKEYDKDNIVMTRSFLSTSKDPIVVECFLDLDTNHDYDNRIPVICTYEVKDPGSSLDINTISFIENEDEVLILPFVVFRVTEKRDDEINRGNSMHRVIRIKLEERVRNVS
ncbi:unnamed protein product [Rotaria sp. Silwood1]|nr:unnamed protein product [Rotaria sp. Silwood1]CAF3684546.1 unnamed protein product [Rotaria sp. Silwood1]CAF3755634.1 unnamed protein product [Rotaria sp. Silwood1]CAF4993540.1 unnamed protein product [Rotaria sp. Silwood1]CAF5077148.1 unnamed protein product [Rotaria sp. Silwood1]